MKKPIVSVVADIRDVEACRAAFTDVSCVVHCAARVSYAHPSPADMSEVNVTGKRKRIYRETLITREEVLTCCVRSF